MFFELMLLLTLLHMKFKVIWSDVRMIPSLIDLMLVTTHLIAHYNHQKCANHHWTPWHMTIQSKGRPRNNAGFVRCRRAGPLSELQSHQPQFLGHPAQPQFQFNLTGSRLQHY